MAGGLIKARQSSDAALEKSSAASPPAWSYSPPDEPGSGIPWSRYFAAVRRYKWLMLAVIVAGTALGVAATRLSKPVYEVQATIWISEAEPRYGREERGPIRADELVNPGAWIELFKSFAVLDSVVTKMALYRALENASDSIAFADFALGERFRPGSYTLTAEPSRGQYVLAINDGVEIERATIGDSVGRRVGFHWMPARGSLGNDGTISFSIVNPRDISIALQKEVTAVLPQGSNFLRVSLEGTDPQRRAAILNAWTDEFVSTAAELKKRNLVELAKVLEAQLRLAENGLKRAERALENLRVHTITLPSESGPIATAGATPDPVRNAFLTYKAEYDNLRHDRQTLENLIAEVRQGTLPADALLSLQPVREGADNVNAAIEDLRTKQAALRAARERYTDEHRTVRDLQQSIATLERQTIPQLATSFLDQFTRREQDLSARIETTSRELRGVPSRTMEELRLRRELTIAQDLHTALQNRYEEARLAEASAVPDVSILDAAVAPQAPKTNRAPLIVFAAFLGSVAAALALALLLDKLDKRLRYPEQAARELGVDVIGAIPPLKARADVDPVLAAEETEAFRSVRLHLQQAFDTSPVLLTISSPGVGDGKSTVSSKLAKSFAKAGYRTLIIDGDTRRGSLHSVFRAPARPGLLDYLTGDASIKEILREAPYENLSIIPRGSKRERGPELLASEGMSHLIGTLEGQYDTIIVDSPPLGAGIDPFALGTATGNMLLVLRPGETDRKVAEAKLKTLERFPIRLLGAVLNDVPLEGAYQQYSYVYGYTADEEALPSQRTAEVKSIVRSSAESASPHSP
jgi:capsular exopolysaccharide synthesis family protein